MSSLFSGTIDVSADSVKHAVYLGVKDYGMVDSAAKDSFIHRFSVDGQETEYTILSGPQDNYHTQNLLQEGYIFDLSEENGSVTDAQIQPGDISGTVTEQTADTISIEGIPCRINDNTKIYLIDNYNAGSTAVRAASTEDIIAGSTRVRAFLDGDTITDLYICFIADSYQAPVKYEPGKKTLKNFLAAAMQPTGTTLFIYGGAWDWEDEASSYQSNTIGIPQTWIDFFQMQDASYIYKNSDDPAHSYYPHNRWNQYYYAGTDCSGYVAWAVYNTLHTQNGSLEDGYVMSAVQMAKYFSEVQGWGSFTRERASEDLHAGDIFSLNGHVWICVGRCKDESVVLLHSTPSEGIAGYGGGVQLSAVNPYGDADTGCEAYRLVSGYMSSYYPEWSQRYNAVLCPFTAYTTPGDNENSGKFSWYTDSEPGAILSDPDGYTDLSAEEILADLFDNQ